MTTPNPFEQLVALARDPLTSRVRFCTVTSRDTVTKICSVDDGSGDTLDGLPYYGGDPIVGDSGLLLTFDSSAAVITMATGSTWDGGTASLASHFLSTLEVDGDVQAHSDVILGDYTDTGGVVRVRGFYDPDTFESRSYLQSGGSAVIALSRNGVEVNRFRVNADGSIAVGPTGGRIVNVPFAQWMGNVTLPAISAGSFSQVQCNFPAGRFTVPPLVVCTANPSNIMATWASPTTAKVDIFGREINAGSSSGGAVTVYAMQMTPTAASA